MKLKPVTKLDKRNKTTAKKIDDNFISANCDVIVIFPIYGQFGAIRKPDSGRISVKRTKSPSELSQYLFEPRYYYCQKMLIFCKKMLTSAKLRGPWC